MDLEKRFLKYVSFDTQSDENSNETPSTSKQLLLAKYLVNELKSIGCNDVFVDQYGIVYATIPSNVDYQTDSIGFIAHMDTSPDCSGKDIKPRIINKYFIELFKKTTNPNYPIRRISLGFSNVIDERYESITLFSDPIKDQKEKDIQNTILQIKKKYGKNSILKGMNLQEKATTKKRNNMVGGHNAQ